MTPRPGWSLERRLPLLILGLLACTIGAFGVAAYGAMRGAATERAEERLGSVARFLKATSAASAPARAALLRGLAADSLVRRALADPLAGPAALARIERTNTPADSTIRGWVFRLADGRLRVLSGDPPTPADLAALAHVAPQALAGDTVARTPFYAVHGRMHQWNAVPVTGPGGERGVLAERRRIGRNPRVLQQLRELTGIGVSLAYANDTGSTWSTAVGDPTPPLLRFAGPVPDAGVVRAADTDGRPVYATRVSVPGTQWRLVLWQPESEVLARAHDFARALALAGLLVLAAAAVLAWVLSRHVTRPLGAITEAAEAIAGGDYRRRTGAAASGGAELARLATTFDAMASRVETALDALADRNRALERANRAKAQFLAMMSHELRTPLNAIGGYAELVELGVHGPVTPAQRDALERVRRNKDHLLALITDVLDFARADAGRISVTLAPVPLAEVLREVEDVMAPQYAAKRVALAVPGMPAAPPLVAHADRARLRQVLLNLLTNALKFTPAAGQVTVRADGDAEVVRVTVRDTGIGIPADRLESIFEPFTQVDQGLTRRADGSGLGLAIARDLARAMGGDVSVESAEGTGSAFTVTLPRTEPAPDGTPAPDAREPAAR